MEALKESVELLAIPGRHWLMQPGAGSQIIGYTRSAEGTEVFQGQNPATSDLLPTTFHEASEAEIDRAMEAASGAFRAYRNRPAEDRARFLEAIAANLEELGDRLLETADAETALGIPRLTGERARACGTARMFASMIREGSWVDARIETAIPDRQPFPKPDVRLMHRPVGPVVVFGASNFPFAISVAGTDTVSALAAGCPVVVKAHPAHPNTCELIGEAIVKAARTCELPDGVFSLIHGRTHQTGIRLVEHSETEVVAFTGSLKGGRALMDVANQRPRPVPFYGEMGSLNPVFVLPAALRKRGEEIAQGYIQSLTLGTGQFCTNPALVLGFRGDDLEGFLQNAAAGVSKVVPTTMLHDGIYQAWLHGTQRFRELDGLSPLAESDGASETERQAAAMIFRADVDQFFAHEEILREEVFGPSSVILECDQMEEMLRFANAMEGSLSATVHAEPEDLETHRELLDILETKTGRLILNGFPTGLEVCTAIHHGGPYPASTHHHFTSVGTNSIYRFVRPVCYQDHPESILPEALRDENPAGLLRMINGVATRDSVG